MKWLPFEYAVRNLGRSRPRLAASVLGSALVVLLVLASSAFVRGMEHSLTLRGSHENVILLGAGSEDSVERSQVESGAGAVVAAAIPGIRSRLGVAYVSPEVHVALAVDVPAREPVGQSAATRTRPGAEPPAAPPTTALFRGVTPAAFLVHPQVRIVEGRAPRPAAGEVIVGGMAAARLGRAAAELAVGRALRVDGQDWTIVGRFEAPGTVMDAEIWCPLSDLQVATRRDSLSCVVLTLDNAEFADVDAFCKQRLDLELVALRESDYYAKLLDFYRPIRALVWATAALVALGGALGGLNTMYAAFASRVRELATLQTLGYSRRAIALSLTQEAVLATAAGALIAAALAVTALDGLAVRFSMGAFGLRVDATVIAIALLAGVALGVIGAIPPAWRCLRMPVPAALRAA